MTGKLLGRRSGHRSLLLLVVVLVVWLPFRRSVIGRAAYAVGSSEQAAYMSGVPIGRAKFARLHARRACSPRSPACC